MLKPFIVINQLAVVHKHSYLCLGDILELIQFYDMCIYFLPI
jgi:hypothetical protein